MRPVDGLDIDALADDTDAVFLALPEHAAAEVAPALLARGKRVFDLSGAFRLRDAALRQRWYPKTGEQPASVVYGLTERNRDLLRDSTLVACAGCYPTAAILALQPLLQANLDRPADHHRRQVGRLRRGEDADRTDALQRVPRQPVGVRRLQPPARRGNRAGARRPGHVRAAPAADRSRDPRNDLRHAPAGRGRGGDRARRCTPRTRTRRSCG